MHLSKCVKAPAMVAEEWAALCMEIQDLLFPPTWRHWLISPAWAWVHGALLVSHLYQKSDIECHVLTVLQLWTLLQVRFPVRLELWRHWQIWTSTTTNCQVRLVQHCTRTPYKIPSNDQSQNTNLLIFVGAIPGEIGQLTELTKLYLYDNSLSGKLHSWKTNREVTY